MTSTGGCACGQIRYRINAELRSVANCHCEPCRRITGHFMAATATNASALTVDSQQTLRWYQRTSTIDYGFCSHCGSTLFWRAADKPDHISITAGSLDQPTGLTTTVALFGESAGDYHDLDSTIPTFAADQDLGSRDD